MFEEFNNDLYLRKSKATKIKKTKIFNTSHNIAHLSIFVLTEPHTYMYNILCKSHDLLYFALILEKKIKKCNFLQILILSFFFEQDLYEV